MLAYIMIGAPGSGKSTKANQISRSEDAEVVCLDTLRKELWGDESVQGPWEELRQRFVARVSEIAESGRTIIVDATHARAKNRKYTLSVLHINGYDEIQPVIVHPSLDCCLKQNAARDRQVPEDVIRRMWNSIDQNFISILSEFDTP
jgi:predicted kinase